MPGTPATDLQVEIKKMHVKKIKAAGVPTSRAVDFVGEVGTLFYDHETGILRISDGHTPGGHLVYQDLTSEIGDIIPSLDLTYNLGSLTHQWRSLYVGTSTIYIGGTALSVASGTVTLDGIPIISTATDYRFTATTISPLLTLGGLWFNSEEGRLYVNYNNTWIDASPTVIPPPSTYLDEIEIDGSTLYINGSTLTISNTGTLLVNGGEVTGSGNSSGSTALGDRLTTGSYSVVLGEDGILTLPSGNTRIGDVFGNGSSGIMANTGTAFGVVTQGTGGYIALEWIDNIENIGSTTTQVAAVIVNSPFALTTGTVQIATGISSGPVSSNIWDFGVDGVLTLSTASTILGNSEDPNVYIETSTTATTSTWTFGTDGILTLPADTPIIKGSSTDTDVTIIAANTNTTSTWVFGADGILTLPDANTLNYTSGINFNFEGYNFNRIRNHNSSVFLEGVEDAPPGYEVYGKGAVLTQLAVSGVDVSISTDIQGQNNGWTFGTDGTTKFPDNTIKNNTSTHITVAGVASTSTSLAWYNIFGELNNSTSTNITIDGSVVYDTEGNLYVLGSTVANGDDFFGTNLFLKYSPQGELLWRKTWTDPLGDACGSYNASMRFWPAESTATIDTIVWASNGDSWTTSDRSGYIGTMDLEGNLVDLQGQARAPLALPDYRITDIVPLLYPGFDGAYVSGSWYDRADTGWNYAAIAGVDFDDVNDNVNWIFIPADAWGGNNGGHFKSINAVFGGLWATGSYNSSANGYYINRTILGLLDIIGGAPGSPTPYLYTIGNNYPGYSMWIEDSGSDANSNIYGLINVWGYNNDTHIQYNNHTVLASATLNSTLTIDRWQKKIRRAGADDGGLNVHGLGLANHEGYVYVSVLLSDNSGGDGDVGLLKLDSVTGAVVCARTIGSPFSDGVWNDYEGGYASSSDIVVDPTGTYISFTAVTQDQSTGTQYANNFTIQYPLDGSLLGTFNDFEITDSIAEFVVTDHDFDVVDITGTANITTATFTVTTATLTASATTVGEGWTNFRWPLEAEVTGTADQTWTFSADGGLTFPDATVQTTAYVPATASASTYTGWFRPAETVVQLDTLLARINSTGTMQISTTIVETEPTGAAFAWNGVRNQGATMSAFGEGGENWVNPGNWLNISDTPLDNDFEVATVSVFKLGGTGNLYRITYVGCTSYGWAVNIERVALG